MPVSGRGQAPKSKKDEKPEGPTDLQILAALKSVNAKHGPVTCLRYIHRGRVTCDEHADAIGDAIYAAERARLTVLHHAEIHRADHPVLNTLMTVRPLVERKDIVGVKFHLFLQGAPLTVDENGSGKLQFDGEQIAYTFDVMPLAMLYGRRIGAVWGQEGLPGTTPFREALATRLLIRTLLSNEPDGTLRMGGSSLPLVEVRSARIGEFEGKPVYGFQIMAYSESTLLRLNAVAEQLREQGLELVTLDDYRERLVALKATGNQEVDEAETKTEGRKFMIWQIPRTLTPEALEELLRCFFDTELEDLKITVSHRGHPYAWFVLATASQAMHNKAADFENVLQAKYGMAISVALSRTRLQRIRMNSTHRDRLDQQAALNPAPGLVKEVFIPKKVIQDALLEPAFLDLWIDAVYDKLGGRLVTDLSKAIEVRTDALVTEKLAIAMQAQAKTFEMQLEKIRMTLDSAVDFALDRAIEARALQLGSAAQTEAALRAEIDSLDLPEQEDLSMPLADLTGQKRAVEIDVVDQIAATAASAAMADRTNAPPQATPSKPLQAQALDPVTADRPKKRFPSSDGTPTERTSEMI
jgi:hypothetical protein